MDDLSSRLLQLRGGLVMTLDLSEPIIDLEGDVKATISVLLEEKVIKKSPTQEQILAIAYTIQRKYDSIKKVRQLIRGGAMSSLETTEIWYGNGYLPDQREPQPLYRHERKGPHAYDPKVIKPFTNKNLEETKDFWKSWNCEYLYVFFNNKWFHYPLEGDI